MLRTETNTEVVTFSLLMAKLCRYACLSGAETKRIQREQRPTSIMLSFAIYVCMRMAQNYAYRPTAIVEGRGPCLLREKSDVGSCGAMVNGLYCCG